ncbi:MAG: SGNH/GDSL hydrolase family protein [bacterium]|nr:SGNH/GDSL hydrolase family protein [bacterium]
MITLPDIKKMYEKAVISKGNGRRLVKALRKAKEGQTITVGFIGGAITAGYNAIPRDENSYAALTYKWFNNTFKTAHVKYVNAGIGATDSYLGVHRVEKDLLEYNPDIVIVEFAVDDKKEWNKESYDSLLRKIYLWSSNPAVVLLFLTNRDGVDNQGVQQEIGAYYGFPMISYRNAIIEELKNGRLGWNLIASDADGIHPENTGHFMIAHFLTTYFEETMELINHLDELPEDELKPAYTEDIYKEAKMVNNTNAFPCEVDMFDPIRLSYVPFHNGFRTTTGGLIVFELYAKNIGVVYYGTQDGLSGKFDVLVDGEFKMALDADFVTEWGNFADYREVYRSSQEKVHKVEIRRSVDSRQDYFTILGFTIS